MVDYDDKEQAEFRANACVSDCLSNLHPTDKAEAYKKVGNWAQGQARHQAEANERDGIPERHSDLDEKVARSRL